MGAASAMFAAVDGGARLWDQTGIWKRSRASRFYQWRIALRAAGGALIAAGAVLLFLSPLQPPWLRVSPAWSSRSSVSSVRGARSASASRHDWRSGLNLRLCRPSFHVWHCSGALVGTAALVISFFAQSARGRRRRRTRRGVLRLIGSPLTSARTIESFASELWHLIRGAAPLQQPRDAELAAATWSC